MKVNLSHNQPSGKAENEGKGPSYDQKGLVSIQVSTQPIMELHGAHILTNLSKTSSSLDDRNLLNTFSQQFGLLSTPKGSAIFVCSLFNSFSQDLLPYAYSVVKHQVDNWAEINRKSVFEKLMCCAPLHSQLLITIVQRACAGAVSNLGQSNGSKSLSAILNLSQRDYGKLVAECLEAAGKSSKSLENLVDEYPWLVYNPELSKKDERSAIHFMCENLVELLNIIGCIDQASSLAYLIQKVQLEILKIPFERHLAAALHLEIRRSVAEDLFYFAYLDSLLMFVERVPLFFKYHRIASLLRSSSGQPTSRIEGIARFKIGNKFGDAEDLSILSSRTRIATNKVLQTSPAAGAVLASESLEVEVFSVNLDSFGYQPDTLIQGAKSQLLLKPRLIEESFLETTGKQCQLISELSTVELQYGSLRVLAPQAFLELVVLVGPQQYTAGGTLANRTPKETTDKPTADNTRDFVLAHLQKLGVVDETHQLVPNIGEVLLQLKAQDGLVDLVDYDVDQLLGLFDRLEAQQRLSLVSPEAQQSNQSGDMSGHSVVMLQSRIVKILKSAKSMTTKELRDQLKSSFAIQCSDIDLRQQLTKLAELQFLIIKEPELVEYLP